ncbi:MAG: aminodeoxychorismate synthase component I, partial [Bacteroidetes bacterium CG_4_10_14_3_um_filter_42_6]
MNTGFEQMNEYGKDRIPFLFVIDFDGNQVIVTPLDQVDRSLMLYSFNGKSNMDKPMSIKDKLTFRITPISRERYQKAFKLVQQHLHYGDSFLLNLTMPSVLESNYSLQEIFYSAHARYQLWMKDRFVVFSPETFVTIKENIIRSFPMKGTIDASIADAERKLLESEKELAEHYTIVDLIRNDLSMVSKNVRVERFRYIERLETHRHCLLQMSSEIAGDLASEYHKNIGTILSKMLPAG